MNVEALLSDFEEFARVAAGEEDSVTLLLQTAAEDVAHAADYQLPEDAAELPASLRLAILDHAAMLYDHRASDAPRGLSATASRGVARYRGVSLGAADAE